MKYIRTEDREGRNEIFVFPVSVNHDAMAEVLYRIKNKTTGDWERLRREAVSAGFVSKDGECFGCSVTLGIKSDPTDTKLLLEQYEL